MSKTIVTGLVLAVLSTGADCLQWSPGLQDNAVVYAYVGGTLSLPWNLTLSGGDSIVDIQWFYLGLSEELIATEAHGNLLVMPAFSGRVRKISNVGIEIDGMQVLEKGNFSVEIVGRSAADDLVNLRRSVHVFILADETEARLAVLEARQESLENKNSDLTNKYTTLKLEKDALENRVDDLHDKNTALAGLLNQTVSFHVRLHVTQYDLPVESSLILPRVLNNHGNAYDNDTGKFTAPYTATYCFLATTTDVSVNGRSALSLMVDDTEVDFTETGVELTWQSAAAHAVVHVTAGQEVWLKVRVSDNYFDTYGTAFSGFLVDHS